VVQQSMGRILGCGLDHLDLPELAWPVPIVNGG
jgi:hypothetical protein